jgi:hypothetical protein
LALDAGLAGDTVVPVDAPLSCDGSNMDGNDRGDRSRARPACRIVP